jgi:site-specific recombinase XerD
MKPLRKKPQIQPWDCEGLQISVRGTTFRATGTLRVGQRSERVRKTLGVPAAKDNMSKAESEARRIADRVRAKLGGGVTRKAVATVVADRFKAHIGPSDKRILEEFTARFTTRILWDIPSVEIVAFADQRQSGNKAESRERWISGLCSFLNLQIAAGQYPKLPEFKRDQKARNPLKRARRNVQQFRVELLEDIIEAAQISLGMQLRIAYAAGARVSSLLQGCTLGDLDMATLTLTFRDTKNGDDVPVALPASMRPALEAYLEWRQLQVRRGKTGPGSDQPLFLHYKGRPYKPNGGAWGTQNKRAFNNAKRRAIAAVGKRYGEAIAAMRAAADTNEVDRLLRLKSDDLKLLASITQHWLRHKFATDTGRKDLRAAMAQGGWRDPRSINGYLIADAEFQRAIVDERGTPSPMMRKG